MQTGLTLQELASEIVEQARAKTDLLADNSDIRSTHVTDERGKHHAIEVGDHILQPNAVFNSQLASQLKIPKPYFDRMASEAPEILDRNVNEWLQAPEYREKRRMVRVMHTTARAYLSSGYRTLDNYDLAEAILPAVGNLQLQVKSSAITDRRLYLQAVSPRLEGEVKVGQPVQGGIVISNSEVGLGAIDIEHMIYILTCLNGQITGSVFRKTHVGRGRRGSDDLGVEEFYKDSTRRLDDAALFAKVRDAIAHTLSPESFQRTLDQMREAGSVRIAKPKEAVEVITKQLTLNEAESEGVLANLIEGGDLSKWGMANAVTALANQVEDYDRAVELERAGQAVVELPHKQWQDTLAIAG